MYISFIRDKNDYLVKYSKEYPQLNIFHPKNENVSPIGKNIIECINNIEFLKNSFFAKYISITDDEAERVHDALYSTIAVFADETTLDGEKLGNDFFLEVACDSAIMYKFIPDTLENSCSFGRGERLSFHMSYQQPSDLYSDDGNLTQIYKVDNIQEGIAVEFIKYFEAVKDKQAKPFKVCRYCHKVFLMVSRNDQIYCSLACKEKAFTKGKKSNAYYTKYRSLCQRYCKEAVDSSTADNKYGVWASWAKNQTEVANAGDYDSTPAEFAKMLKSKWDELKKESGE